MQDVALTLQVPVRPDATTSVGLFHTNDVSVTDGVSGDGIPISNIDKAVNSGLLERLSDSSWYASIPQFEGLWANNSSPAETLAELRCVLIDWLCLKIADGDNDIPVVAGMNLNYQTNFRA